MQENADFLNFTKLQYDTTRSQLLLGFEELSRSISFRKYHIDIDLSLYQIIEYNQM